MYIARILFPVKVLGPGNRIAIWFNGCSHQCKGCCNRELWEFRDNYKTDVITIVSLIKTIEKDNNIDGFTLTGGDPFFQPEALRELIPELYTISSDILCYTGYKYEELQSKYLDIMQFIAVLIDGKYEEEHNYGEMLRGSNNQNIILLKPEYKNKYEKYCNQKTSEIQNFYIPGGVISTGIHGPEFKWELDKKLKEKGVIRYYE